MWPKTVTTLKFKILRRVISSSPSTPSSPDSRLSERLAYPTSAMSDNGERQILRCKFVDCLLSNHLFIVIKERPTKKTL